MTASLPAVATPSADEYSTYFGRYVARLPAGPTSSTSSPASARRSWSGSGRAGTQGGYRYPPGKWSVRQVVLHLSDTERIMAYRALRFARGDATPLPGFEEEAYAAASGADAVPLAELVAGLADVRRATIGLLRQLSPEAWMRRGTASNAPFSVRALAWVMAGHVVHHLDVLRERYGL